MLTLTKFANTAIANTDQNIPVEVIEKFMKMKPIDVLSGEDPGPVAALYEGSIRVTVWQRWPLSS